MTEANKPLATFRAGGVSATVWQNEGKKNDGTPFQFKTVNVERSYKDAKDEWKKTSAMRVNDLPKVALVAQQAYAYLFEQGSGEGAE